MRKYNISKIILCSIASSFGAATLVSFLIPNDYFESFISPLNLFRIGIMIVFVTTLLLYIKSYPKNNIPINDDKRQKRIGRLAIILPALAILVSLINLFFPEFGHFLVKGTVGSPHIYRPGIYLKLIFDLISCGVFVYLAVRFLKTKNLFPFLAVAFLALILFWMAMEEISWGQRIFGWETSDYFLENNMQGETNLHNLNTQLFQNALYFGGFLLLIVLPFFRDNITKLLNRAKKLRWISQFLPSAWMIAAFAATIGFTDPYESGAGWRWGSILFSFIATATILAVYAYRLHKNNDGWFKQVAFTLFAFLVTLSVSLASPALWNLDSGAPTEYIELFIAFGILCWAIDLKNRFKSLSYNLSKS